MATFTKLKLSGSTGGRGIAVVSTTIGTGSTIHATNTTSGNIDEIWLYANNTHSAALVLTLEFGGTISTTDYIQQSIAATPSGLVLVCAGLILANTGSALTITASTTTASKLEIFGFVNRIA